MLWQGFVMRDEEIDSRFDKLWNELSELKETLSLDEFAKRVSDIYEIPFEIAKCYTMIANNTFCRGTIYAVLANIKRLLKTKMYCDAYEVCQVYGEAETFDNAGRYLQHDANNSI